MKTTKVLFSMLLLLSGSIALAQETIALNVVYEFRYVRDLENKDVPYTTNMILSLGKHSSRYCTEKLYDQNDKNAILARQKQQQALSTSARPTSTVTGGPMLMVNKFGAIINEEIVKDTRDQQLMINALLGIKTYKIETSLPKIDWTIENDKKKIGNYTCQKAVANFGGRTYIAWFSPDLPFQDGPWKLHGLPGLILEAQDTKNEVSFIFKELGRNTDPEETTRSFLSSEFSIKTNLKSYSRARTAFETDPESAMAAMAPNAKLYVINIDDPKAQQAARIKKYNPIEFD